MLQTDDRKVAAIAGLLSIFMTALLAIEKTGSVLKEFLPKSLSPELLGIAAFGFFAIAFWFLIRLRGKSRLARPDKLRLDASNPAHLFGREDDVRRLSEICQAHPQVHFIGASGSGKSALLKGGLVPALKDSQLLPIYMDIWGEHWEEGPKASLCQSLWAVLPDGCRQSLGLDVAPTADEIFNVLRRIKSKCTRTPLIILDQFDDYQTRHRGRFISRRSTWTRPKTLSRKNEFFRSISDLLRSGSIHCLIATRADNAAGLESIRFVTPAVYNLSNLNSATVKGLIQTITQTSESESSIIERPESGWNRLTARLVEDLAADGTILAVQMRLALMSLADLDELSVAAYDRVGGLAGLQTKYITDHVTNSARNVGLRPELVRRLLLTLVDQESGDGSKTVSRSFSFISQALLSWGIPNETLQAVLDDLTSKEVIRKRINPDSKQEEYLLDHDYLSNAVREVEASANRSAALLKDSQRSFRAATSIIQHWNALLSPTQLLSILIARARKQIRFNECRAYVAASLLRLCPMILIIGCLVAGVRYYYLEDQNRSEATDLIEALDWRTDSPSPAELRSIWHLAQKNPKLKTEFVELALSNKRNSVRITRRKTQVARALTGLDPSLRETIERAVLKRIGEKPRETSIRTACVALGSELEMQDSRFLDFAVANTLDGIDNASGDVLSRMEAVAAGMGSFSRLNAAQRKSIVDALLSRLLESKHEVDDERWLLRPLEGIPGLFDHEESERAWTFIHMQLFEGSRYMWGSPASDFSANVVGHFPKDERRKIFAALLEQLAAALQDRTTEWQAAKIDAVLQYIGTSEDLPERHAVLESVLSLLRNAQSSSEVEASMQNVGYLPTHFTKAEAASATRELARFVDSSFGDPVRINPGMSIVESAMQRMDQDDSAEFAHLLIKSAKEHSALPEGQMLISEVARLRPLMGSAQRQELDAITSATQTQQNGLSARITIDRLIEMIEKSAKEGSSSGIQDNTLLDLVARFTTSSADDERRLADHLVPWIKSRIGPIDGAVALANVMRSPSFPVDEQLRQRCFEAIATVIINSAGQGFYVRDDELTALQKIPGEWGGPAATQLLAALLSLPNQINDALQRRQRFSNMEREIQAVLPKVRSPESRQLVQMIVDNIKLNADNMEILGPLVALLSAMPPTSDVQEIVGFLKYPSVAGSCDKTLLSILELDLHQPFGGDVWTFSEWASNHPEVGLARPLTPLSAD